MKTMEEKWKEAYEEAKCFCEMYVNWNGDKRRHAYKRLQAGVVEIWIPRMNNFGRKLGLPLYSSLFN